MSYISHYCMLRYPAFQGCHPIFPNYKGWSARVQSWSATKNGAMEYNIQRPGQPPPPPPPPAPPSPLPFIQAQSPSQVSGRLSGSELLGAAWCRSVWSGFALHGASRDLWCPRCVTSSHFIVPLCPGLSPYTIMATALHEKWETGKREKLKVQNDTRLSSCIPALSNPMDEKKRKRKWQKLMKYIKRCIRLRCNSIRQYSRLSQIARDSSHEGHPPWSWGYSPSVDSLSFITANNRRVHLSGHRPHCAPVLGVG